MSDQFVLADPAYGKSQVRLVKIERGPERHDVRDITVAIRLEGDFDAAFLAGDNSRVLPTDTMKNTVYALAAGAPLGAIELFGTRLATHFLEATAAKVLLEAPHGALEYLAHLAGPQVAERLPGQLDALLVPGTIESDQVECGLSRRSDEVLYTTVTEPVFGDSRLPSFAARSA